MNWHTWKPALALGAVLAAGGTAGAADGPPATTMTLGGRGTADQAATEDTELARGYRYGGYRYGGYYGWGGGYRWGGYGWGGGYRWGGYGWGGGYRYGGFYPGYSVGFYRPAFYYSSFYAPVYRPFPAYSYSSFYYGGCHPGFGFGIGIGGAAAPTVPLGQPDLARPLPQPMAPPMNPPAAPNDGTFRYDGGPSDPVPLPKADPQPAPGADLPVSLKPKAAPLKYKAYGEK